MKFIVIDTETYSSDMTNIFGTPNAVDVSAVKYDTETGRTTEFCMIIDGPICDFSAKLNPGYYEALPKYPVEQVRDELYKFLADGDVITAFNCKFDELALSRVGINVNFSFCLKQKYEAFTENNAEYISWCEERGLTSKIQHGRKSGLSAQNAYRFLKKDDSFVEKHTGLDDAHIELAIAKNILQF